MAADVGVDAVASYLRDNGFSSVNEYMNDGLTTFDVKLSPESNLQILAANSSIEANG